MKDWKKREEEIMISLFWEVLFGMMKKFGKYIVIMAYNAVKVINAMKLYS